MATTSTAGTTTPNSAAAFITTTVTRMVAQNSMTLFVFDKNTVQVFTFSFRVILPL